MENSVYSLIEKYDDGRESIMQRYASFDLCYNYFFNNKGNLTGEKMQMSCCQLWAYLSSWGMVTRGNVMQSKSYASLKNVVKYINDHPEHYNIKLTDEDYIIKVLTLYHEIDNALGIIDNEQKSRKTLITKIILGTYACCPAFDSRFCRTFGTTTVGELSEKNLKSVVDFYNVNRDVIDKIVKRTLCFDSECHEKCHLYTPSKLIDMYGFEKNGKQ